MKGLGDSGKARRENWHGKRTGIAANCPADPEPMQCNVREQNKGDRFNLYTMVSALTGVQANSGRRK